MERGRHRAVRRDRRGHGKSRQPWRYRMCTAGRAAYAGRGSNPGSITSGLGSSGSGPGGWGRSGSGSGSGGGSFGSLTDIGFSKGRSVNSFAKGVPNAVGARIGGAFDPVHLLCAGAREHTIQPGLFEKSCTKVRGALRGRARSKPPSLIYLSKRSGRCYAPTISRRSGPTARPARSSISRRDEGYWDLAGNSINTRSAFSFTRSNRIRFPS